LTMPPCDEASVTETGMSPATRTCEAVSRAPGVPAKVIRSVEAGGVGVGA
jgi:hypothetical protein